jgi:hypothetical protein
VGNQARARRDREPSLLGTAWLELPALVRVIHALELASASLYGNFVEILGVAPQVGFGTAGASVSEVPRFPRDDLGRQDRRSREWLAALDDFRNWLRLGLEARERE